MTQTLEEFFAETSKELGSALNLNDENSLKGLQSYLGNALTFLNKDIDSRSNYSPAMLPYCIIDAQTKAAFEKGAEDLNKKILLNIFVEPSPNKVTKIIEGALSKAYTQKFQ
jgi:hypothetical protein